MMKKYSSVAKDSRILNIRPATADEAEGDPTGVIVELAEGFTYEGSSQFLAFSVADCRLMLRHVEMTSEG